MCTAREEVRQHLDFGCAGGDKGIDTRRYQRIGKLEKSTLYPLELPTRLGRNLLAQNNNFLVRLRTATACLLYTSPSPRD